MKEIKEGNGTPALRFPVSTYRLQFNHRFRFRDAESIIPYLHGLGITDIYASPYVKARKGSLHGYDIVDPNTLNPEVGTEEEYDAFVREIQKYGMGQILDIVPNHMCTESDNSWWMDVLENGPSSLYAGFFDIDWTPSIKKLTNKILIPLLGDQYGKVLERQELKLIFEGGAFFLTHYEKKFPILPNTYLVILEHRIEDLRSVFPDDDHHLVEFLSILTALKHLPLYTETAPEKIAERNREKEIIKKRLFSLCSESPGIKTHIDETVGLFNGLKGDPKSFNLLDRLLGEQVWRLSHWRVATEELNYRRFFDINNLAAIHAQDLRVFQETHKLILRLVAEGKVTGLRVDHPDGLYDPFEYFLRLQQTCSAGRRALREGESGPVFSPHEQADPGLPPVLEHEVRSPDPPFRPCYIVGEKILTKGEKMPDEWPFFGTTGYAFLNFLNGIFVETRNARAFDKLYARFMKTTINFQDTVYEKKKLVMQVTMSGEISTLGNYLNTISEKNRHTRDYTLDSLTRAIVEVIALFPVYRTYINSYTVEDRDAQYIEPAVSKAKRKNPAISSSVFDFLRDVLLLKFPEELGADDRSEWLSFVMKFQQLTGPVMAKGLEDTAFYVYNRIVSLNEVGGSPEKFGTSLEAFHGQNIERNKFWPHSLITTSTHDTKRSEDVRARINVLSEIPERWKECLIRWSRFNRKKKAVVEGQTVPDRNEEYLLYQTLIGAWPVGPMQARAYGVFKARIKEYMIKAIREAKINTSWINPNTVYEAAVLSFIDAVITPAPDNSFLEEFMPFQKTISRLGMFTSLSQTVLKIASPGVPDFFQGTEIWDYSLVDPDNRRPVDYQVRIRMLDELKKEESKSGPLQLAEALTAQKENGKIKLYVTYKMLNYRRENRDLFDSGEYVPLVAAGEKAYHVCAFARRSEDAAVLVIAPRFFHELLKNPEDLPVGKAVWDDACVMLPFEAMDRQYVNLFTGERIMTMSRNGTAVMHLAEVFSHFPAAIMVRD